MVIGLSMRGSLPQRRIGGSSGEGRKRLLQLCDRCQIRPVHRRAGSRRSSATARADQVLLMIAAASCATAHACSGSGGRGRHGKPRQVQSPVPLVGRGPCRQAMLQDGDRLAWLFQQHPTVPGLPIDVAGRAVAGSTRSCLAVVLGRSPAPGRPPGLGRTRLGPPKARAPALPAGTPAREHGASPFCLRSAAPSQIQRPVAPSGRMPGCSAHEHIGGQTRSSAARAQPNARLVHCIIGGCRRPGAASPRTRVARPRSCNSVRPGRRRR